MTRECEKKEVCARMSDLLHVVKDGIDVIFQWLQSLGYFGIMFGLMIEVIPSEIVLAYAGYLVHQGQINFLGGVVFGTIGGVIAQIFVYWLGKYGGRPFLEKYGKYILIQKKHIDVSEQWFNKYGTGMIFTARFIPVVRHAISIPAGMAKMPLGKFTLLTTLAVIPWSVFFIYLGMALGENWEQIDEKAQPYILPFIIASVGLTVLYLLLKLLRKPKTRKAKRHGDAGERETAHQLKYLGREYVVLNGKKVRAGGGAQEIDHLVVGPNGVFHIETKYWSGEIRFTDQGVERSDDRQSQDPTAQVYRHEFVVKELLRELKVQADVVGIICFAHPHATLQGRSPAFTAIKPDRLVHFIRNYKPKKSLAKADVQKIAQMLREMD